MDNTIGTYDPNQNYQTPTPAPAPMPQYQPPIAQTPMYQQPSPMPTQMPMAKKGHKGLVIVLVILFVLLAVGGGVAFVLSSRQAKYKGAQTLISKVEDTRDSLGKVDTSINDLYGILNQYGSAQLIAVPQTAKTTLLPEQVSASIKEGATKPATTLVLNSASQLELPIETVKTFLATSKPETVFKLVKVNTSKPVVLAKTAIEIYGDMRSSAQDTRKDADLAKEKVSDLKKELAKANSNIKIQLTDSDANVAKSEDYTDEAWKVGNYYAVLSDANTKLYPKLASFMVMYSYPTVSNISTIKSQADELKVMLADIKSSFVALSPDLPKGIDDLHNVTKKQLDAASEFVTGVSQAVDTASGTLYISSGSKFISDSTSLSSQATSYQKSFWQGTPVKGSTYGDLNSAYKDYANTLQKVSDANKPLF